MPLSYRGAAPLAIAWLCVCLSSSGSSFQSSARNGPGMVTPRARPALSDDRAGVARVHLRVDASLALIPVYVATASGTPITVLRKEDFRLFEEGVEQEISYFAQDDAALSVGLVFDASGSMKDKKRKAAEAAAAFLKTANARDEFFLVEFDERPTLSVPFTSDADRLYDRIRGTRPFGRTSLFDAIHLAMAQMRTAQNARKAIVILSDGGDNHSRHTFFQIKNELIESDVQLYAMGIYGPAAMTKLAPEEINGPHLLDDLSGESGGTHFRVDNIADLPEISERLGRELRSQYLLGYSPSNQARDGKYRRVSVHLGTVNQTPPLNVHFRRGYYAPSQ